MYIIYYIFKAQVNCGIDDNIKAEAERACAEMGITMSAAITVFLTKVTNKKRIPFEITADPFYSRENISELEKRISDIRSGKSTLNEHNLIEID